MQRCWFHSSDCSTAHGVLQQVQMQIAAGKTVQAAAVLVAFWYSAVAALRVALQQQIWNVSKRVTSYGARCIIFSLAALNTCSVISPQVIQGEGRSDFVSGG